MAEDGGAFLNGHSTTLTGLFHFTPVHLDPHTCLLQGPILRVCVLAVLLIGRRQQETIHHLPPTLSHPWSPEHIWRPNSKEG